MLRGSGFSDITVITEHGEEIKSMVEQETVLLIRSLNACSLHYNILGWQSIAGVC